MFYVCNTIKEKNKKNHVLEQKQSGEELMDRVHANETTTTDFK